MKSGVKRAREFIEKRERGKHNNIGYNGFMYWAMLNCYVHWHRQFDQELLDDYRYVFTDGIHSKRVQFAQHRGSLVLLAKGLDETNDKYPYVALGATQPFEWNPKSGVLCGSRRPDDSEFRIRGTNIAVGLETALPAEFPAATPAAQLAAFREAVRKGSRMALADTPAGVTARFVDRDGAAIERTFDGDTRVNGHRVAYETWPLLENPWMRQEYGGNLTVTDGKTSRVYDVTNWTIIEETRPWTSRHSQASRSQS